jgi:hypothetical protein
MEKVDVFEAKTGGSMVYRIPGIVVTAKGTVLGYCLSHRLPPGAFGGRRASHAARKES